mmetsp:Transcript_6960/g.26027  ORF Transcript_6960/g.26027 Transcript_6960/m.26027 type:complete len:204 (-) Transcript_6960:343-954(-)
MVLPVAESIWKARLSLARDFEGFSHFGFPMHTNPHLVEGLRRGEHLLLRVGLPREHYFPTHFSIRLLHSFHISKHKILPLPCSGLGVLARTRNRDKARASKHFSREANVLHNFRVRCVVSHVVRVVVAAVGRARPWVPHASFPCTHTIRTGTTGGASRHFIQCSFPCAGGEAQSPTPQQQQQHRRLPHHSSPKSCGDAPMHAL